MHLVMLNGALDYFARNLSLKKIVFGIDGRPKIKNIFFEKKEEKILKIATWLIIPAFLKTFKFTHHF